VNATEERGELNVGQRAAGRRWSILLGSLIGLIAVVGTAQATHTTPDTLGHTDREQDVTGVSDPADGYTQLTVEQVNEQYVLRDGATEPAATPGASAPVAQAGRDTRRVSLAYFSQMSDFQLADEESPARVEFVDQGAGSAWRPQEAFHPFAIDASIRQLNAFADASPVPQGDGTRNPMDLALITGDQADNQQRNETIWVRELLEGGEPLNFNAGLSNATDYANPASLGASCAAFVAQEGSAANAAAEGGNYTGVQDYDDYPVAGNTYFYDPDNPQGSWLADGWPTYTGLMDRAQTLSITPAGLDVPFYLTNGNHDVLVQGNEDANQGFEAIVTGCFKALGTTATPPGGQPDPDEPDLLDPNLLFFPAPGAMLIPPDPLRRFVSKPQIKKVYGEDIAGDDDHGFGYVDPAENQASNGSASYYAWDPAQMPGFHFINIDTNSEGGQTAEGVAPGSSNGNIDNPQFQWLTRELDAAQAANELIVIFGHHPVRSMNTEIADEQALQCTTNDNHPGDDPQHDINPGCDLDPRVSAPIHLGRDAQPGDPRESFVELLAKYPNVIAYVPGHTHENRITPFARADGTLWWELNTSAVADQPQQSRLIEAFDNQDGTLSIFSSVIDHASPSAAPAPGSASGFDSGQLASIGRTFAYNDPQGGFGTAGAGDGRPSDQNVELLLDDPRDGVPNPPPAPPGGGPGTPPNPGQPGTEKCKGKIATIVGTEGNDSLEGTDDADVIVALGGDDEVIGGGGNDRICGKGGNDDLRGNGGKDKLRGGGGNDDVSGGGGNDVVGGGAGKDNVGGGGGEDRCNGGTGRDRERRCE